MDIYTPLYPLRSRSIPLQSPDVGYGFRRSSFIFEPEQRESRIRQQYQRTMQMIEERKRFALFLRILCHQINKSGDIELLYTVRDAVKICNKRKALGDPLFICQMDSISVALRPLVGEVTWSRALRYLRYYECKLATQKRKKRSSEDEDED